MDPPRHNLECGRVGRHDRSYRFGSEWVTLESRERRDCLHPAKAVASRPQSKHGAFRPRIAKDPRRVRSSHLWVMVRLRRPYSGAKVARSNASRTEVWVPTAEVLPR